jgi:hypothetical protein
MHNLSTRHRMADEAGSKEYGVRSKSVGSENAKENAKRVSLLLTPFFLLFTPASADITNGLVGSWDFDGAEASQG